VKPLCYHNVRKGNAAAMIEAFARGSGADITKTLEFVPGRPAVFWGVDAATLAIWRQVVKTGTPYYYIDHGYFRSKWTGGDFFRVTRDAEQCRAIGEETTGERWRALELEIKPWRKSGEHVIVACQSDFWHERHGDGSAKAFADKVVRKLGEYTKRPVVVRGKPIAGHTEPSLAEHFRDCWAVVTYSSMVGAEGLLEGIPVFALGPTALQPMSSGGLESIESPRYPKEREQWAGVLADNQWRLSEIADGTAWKALTA
jgi:hypothetical protein